QPFLRSSSEYEDLSEIELRLSGSVERVSGFSQFDTSSRRLGTSDEVASSCLELRPDRQPEDESVEIVARSVPLCDSHPLRRLLRLTEALQSVERLSEAARAARKPAVCL